MIIPYLVLLGKGVFFTRLLFPRRAYSTPFATLPAFSYAAGEYNAFYTLTCGKRLRHGDLLGICLCGKRALGRAAPVSCAEMRPLARALSAAVSCGGIGRCGSRSVSAPYAPRLGGICRQGARRDPALPCGDVRRYKKMRALGNSFLCADLCPRRGIDGGVQLFWNRNR